MKCARLERLLQWMFRSYGLAVGRRPLPFLLAPLILTLLVVPGFLFLKRNDDVVMLFTPYDAPSRHEQRVVEKFAHVEALDPPLLTLSDKSAHVDQWLFVNVIKADRSNIMDAPTWATVARLIRGMYQNFTCLVDVDNDNDSHNRKAVRYNPDYCTWSNEIAPCPRLDRQVEGMRDILNRTSKNIKFTFPVMHVYGKAVNLGEFIYGVNVDNKTRHLKSAKLAVLKLEFQHESSPLGELRARQCMSQLTTYINTWTSKDEEASKDLILSAMNRWNLNDEVTKTGMLGMPVIPITVVLVTVFTLFVSYYARAPVIGAAEAILGISTIGLSLVISLPLLFACGLPFNFLVSMTPLLVLCVGVDNDFLLTSAWRQPYNENEPTDKRLANALADAGPSLTITSVNDILCFGVGVLSDSPAVSHFCLFTCIALTLRYALQLTFLLGALVYMHDHMPECITCKERERTRLFYKFENAKNYLIQALKHHKPSAVDSSVSSSPDSTRPVTVAVDEDNRVCVDQSDKPKETPREHFMHRFFRNEFARFLDMRLTKLLVVLMFSVYLCGAVYYASSIAVKVQMEKVFTDDSQAKRTMEATTVFLHPQSMIGNVVIMRPPDFRRRENLDRFMEFADVLQNSLFKFAPENPTEVGRLWLRDYLVFSSFMNDAQSDFYANTKEFLRQNDYSQYANDVRFSYSNNGSQLQLQAFRFTVYYENTLTWNDHVDIMLHWRRVCANYSEYEAIVHDYFYLNTYMDQGISLAATTLQTMGIAFLSIAVVTALFMPDASSMFFICFSSLSVDLGVVGALNLWGCDLDPVTMACLLMTIGFSVYYTARVCYCYQTADESWSAGEKLAHAMGTVGWPILQGGLATLIGILPIAFVPAYMLRTFFKTIALVVVIGLLHGLLFMPVIMSVFDRRSSKPLRRKLLQPSSESDT